MNIKINKKEQFYFIIMVAISSLIYFSLISVLFTQPLKSNTFAIYFFYIIAFIVFRLLASTLLIGHIKGNSIKISENQFPDIFDVLKKQSKELGLKKIPNMYVLQGNGVLNAFATRFARKNFIVLYSDVFEMAYEEGKDAVSFIIGHELGHIKRKHINFFKTFISLPARFIPFLGSAYSRACEYTCDNIGYNLAPKGATNGLLILAAGKKLYKKINVSKFVNNKEDQKGFSFWFSEKVSTHPHMVKRLEKINILNENKLENADLDLTFFTANLKNKEIQQ